VHRALVVEARREHNLATSLEAVNYLKQHPEAVKAIQSRLPNIASDLLLLGKTVLDTQPGDLVGRL